MFSSQYIYVLLYFSKCAPNHPHSFRFSNSTHCNFAIIHSFAKMVHLIKLSLLLSIISTYEASGLVSASIFGRATPTSTSASTTNQLVARGSSDLTCSTFQVPTEDDPDENGTDDGSALKSRSVAGRVNLEARAGRGGPSSFGSCPIPSTYDKIKIPGIPSVDSVFRKEGSTKPTDLPLLNGVARYYDRDVSCSGTTIGTTKMKKLDASALTLADTKSYSMDHVCK
jgi:hypothetical protein